MDIGEDDTSEEDDFFSESENDECDSPDALAAKRAAKLRK